MKKILILLLGTLSIVPVALSKPKCLKNAEKLIGNAAEIVQARKYISEAMADTLLERQAYTHYLAGKIEKELYRHYYKKLSINRKRPVCRPHGHGRRAHKRIPRICHYHEPRYAHRQKRS